jgi:large subunit ribosomal protein L4e
MVKSVKILGIKGKSKGSIKIPNVFETKYRPDLIRRAFLAGASTQYQPAGRDPLAGKKTSATSWGTGFGRSRIPRVKGARTHAGQRGGLAPSTVGGRRTHPPKAEKKIVEKINRKERLYAVKSAISATGNAELVRARGHQFAEKLKFPIIVSDDLQGLTDTNDTVELFKKLGIWSDVERVKNGTKIRAGKGKMRGRKYRVPVGALLVISDDYGISLAARNIPGVSVVEVNSLSTHALAPGGSAGRLTIWSESAIEELEKYSTKTGA